MAYAAAHVCLALSDERSATQYCAGAVGPFLHYNHHEVRAPGSFDTAYGDRLTESDASAWREFWATRGQPMG